MKSVQSRPCRRNWTLFGYHVTRVFGTRLPLGRDAAEFALVLNLQIQDRFQDGAENAAAAV
jgi:hypothetical protein